jgi:hypothetical protein
MPSRRAARNIWDQGARDAYRSAGKSVAQAYKGFVTVSGNTATIDGECMKRAAAPLGAALSGAWSD